MQEPKIVGLNWLIDRDRYGESHLFESLRSANTEEVLGSLLDHDFDDWADVQTTTHCSPAFLASLQRVVREEGAKLRAKIAAEGGFNLLFEAASKGETNYVEMLLMMGVNVDCENEFG
jgi:hypothetical protein